MRSPAAPEDPFPVPEDERVRRRLDDRMRRQPDAPARGGAGESAPGIAKPRPRTPKRPAQRKTAAADTTETIFD